MQACTRWIEYIPYVDDRRLVAVGQGRKIALHDMGIVRIGSRAENDAFFLGKCGQALR